MFGIINNAVRGLVTELMGPDGWEKVRSAASAEDTFADYERYDDEVTLGLVVAAANALNTDVNTVLGRFGHYWVREVALKSYAAMIQRSGVDFQDLIKNMDHLHDRIRAEFPGYNPPYFRVKETSPEQMVVDYYSERDGLEPFVEGIFEALGDHFGLDVSVEIVDGSTHPLPCTRMIVHHTPRPGDDCG